MARASNLTMCSFCGKSHAEVRKLIAGPGVYICDSCINVCKSILDKELNEDARRQSSNIRVPKPVEIRRALDQYVIGQETAKKTYRLPSTTTTRGYCKLRSLPMRPPRFSRIRSLTLRLRRATFC